MPDTTPRLQTAPNDNTSQYAPLSWYAMAAFIVAILFAVLLVALGLSALTENKPFNESWLFLFPVLGLVLAFAGRRQIRNSEGTRTGEKYAGWAWWICVVGSLGYGANLLAIGYTIRSDAEKTFAAWTKNMLEANPADANDPSTAAAFYPLTEAGQRENIKASDAQKMRAIYGPKFAQFRQNKVLAILSRNKGQCEFVSEGLQNWEQTPGKIECTLAGTLKTPEADYPLIVPMLAKTGPKGREWQIRIPDGFIPEGQGKPILRTPFGWWMESLSASAMVAAAGEIAKASASDAPMPPDNFFLVLPPEGNGPPRTLDDLKFCWQNANAGRLQMPGTVLSFAPDKNPFIAIFDDHIGVRVPIELRPRDSADRNQGCRGKLVFRLDDPALEQEIRKAQTEGAQAPRTATPPKDIAERKIQWKPVRLESSLKLETPPEKGASPEGG